MGTSGFRLWLASVAALLLAGVAVPYAVFGGGEPSLDIFVFWCLFGVAVVALIAAGFSRWE
ncbi:hypothetical protein [Roseitranquillus sediminis]|uniref:hypothetical protein n=1 Tax=Roseitranquillus sediminis TaxID=2809051 RepID=UPI001D0C60D1|nr:hypothetical protein [Roseitranquillus sediminis]MBM9594222.1 hypothetical protein [Roseitranquillus sediminis]